MAAGNRLQMNARLVRERDRRMTRELVKFLLISAALLIPFLLYVRQRMEYMRVSYHLEELTRQQRRLQEENRKLRVERAYLRAPDRVERIARNEIGLVREHGCEMIDPGPAAGGAVGGEAAP